jgi:hypothetical protein
MWQYDSNRANEAPDTFRQWLDLSPLIVGQTLLALIAAAASGLKFANVGDFFALFGAILAAAAILTIYLYIRMPENKRMIFFLNVFMLYLYTAIVMSTYQYSMALSKAIEISGLIENADHAIGFYWVDFSQKAQHIPYFSDILAFCYKNWIRDLFIALLLLTYFKKFDDVFLLTTAHIFGSVVTLSVSGVLDAKSREAVGAFAFKGLHLPTGVSPIYLAKLEHLRQGVDSTMDFSSMIGLVAFPSFHAGTAILLAAATRNLKYFWLPFLVFNILVVVATITEGGHNLMDVLFGCAFAVGALGLAQAYQRLGVGARLQTFFRAPAGILGETN